MGVGTSETQKKRAEKIERMRKYFGTDQEPKIHEWFITDENLDFSKMSDAEIKEYLSKSD